MFIMTLYSEGDSQTCRDDFALSCRAFHFIGFEHLMLLIYRNNVAFPWVLKKGQSTDKRIVLKILNKIKTRQERG